MFLVVKLYGNRYLMVLKLLWVVVVKCLRNVCLVYIIERLVVKWGMVVGFVNEGSGVLCVLC